MSSWTSEELTGRRTSFARHPLTYSTQCMPGDIGRQLPDEVLLEIFYHNVNFDTPFPEEREEAWQSLAHVCRRWRCIIFESPRHLNLQLVCRITTPARDTLDVWPALPLVISCYNGYNVENMDNIIAVLERSDRVCQITLIDTRNSDLEIPLAAMQQPFPELTRVDLYSPETTQVVPDSFLGGFAPRLEYLRLNRIPFPGLPKLLLSATHLVTLHLFNIPHSGYFSPDAMVTALSTLTSVEYLTLEFRSPRSCPDQASRRLPPSTRSILLALTYFRFKGVSEYLEDLVTCIDAPLLNKLRITFFNDTAFDIPLFMQFISRTPTSRALQKTHVKLSYGRADLHFLSQTSDDGRLNVKILCRGLEWQVSSLEQVCTWCLPSLSMLEDLYIYDEPYSQPDWKDDIESGLWLQLFHPFTTVKNLCLSEKFALRIGPALQELVEGRTTEVFPALKNTFLEGFESSKPVQKGIAKFIAARQVASRPIAVSSWANSHTDKVLYYRD